jgi:hypothetical protein
MIAGRSRIFHTMSAVLTAAVLVAMPVVGAAQAVSSQTSRTAKPVVGAPSLYMPRSVRRAYANGTRSLDGRPGSRYWQNHARYSISVTAAPPNRTIKGSEQVTYWNASPDTLRRLNIKLFLNNHKPGAPRDGGASTDYMTSGTHVERVTVDGQPTPWEENERFFTQRRLDLPKPLAPGDSVRLTFDWHFDMSRESGREGAIDSTTFFLAYFYPRVAVYDDYQGWDTMTFTGSQEFYSDFNDYDVTVNVPANYIVWGTGTLTNAASVLQPAVLQRFQGSLTTDSTVRVVTPADLAAKRVTVQQPTNSWRFTARNIPDMTFGLSDHFNWDAGSVVVDDATNRRASVQAAYDDTSKDYHRMVQYGRHALDWLSHKWPGVPYPYEKTTVFRGFAGMEYPMMANDETYADTVFSRFVAEHEIAHTYFPFYMGINETRYAFMDEGWATTLEYLIGQEDIGPERARDFFKEFRVSGWINDPDAAGDLPIVTPEDALVASAWGNNAYGKAALGYLAAKELLGDELFRKALHEYMARWNGKHPTPWDFFYSFNDATGRNLDWFWKSWYFDNSYIDLRIHSVTKTGSGYDVVLDNIGGMPAPVTLWLNSANSSDSVRVSPAVWEKNPKRATVKVKTKRTIEMIALDGGIWMDADSTGDTWERKKPGAKR